LELPLPDAGKSRLFGVVGQLIAQNYIQQRLVDPDAAVADFI